MTAMRPARRSFGGVGASGMGKYHGIEGFRTLSHPKGFVQGRWNSTRLLRTPFGKTADALLNSSFDDRAGGRPNPARGSVKTGREVELAVVIK